MLKLREQEQELLQEKNKLEAPHGMGMKLRQLLQLRARSGLENSADRKYSFHFLAQDQKSKELAQFFFKGGKVAVHIHGLSDLPEKHSTLGVSLKVIFSENEKYKFDRKIQKDAMIEPCRFSAKNADAVVKIRIQQISKVKIKRTISELVVPFKNFMRYCLEPEVDLELRATKSNSTGGRIWLTVAIEREVMDVLRTKYDPTNFDARNQSELSKHARLFSIELAKLTRVQLRTWEKYASITASLGAVIAQIDNTELQIQKYAFQAIPSNATRASDKVGARSVYSVDPVATMYSIEEKLSDSKIEHTSRSLESLPLSSIVKPKHEFFSISDPYAYAEMISDAVHHKCTTEANCLQTEIDKLSTSFRTLVEQHENLAETCRAQEKQLNELENENHKLERSKQHLRSVLENSTSRAEDEILHLTKSKQVLSDLSNEISVENNNLRQQLSMYTDKLIVHRRLTETRERELLVTIRDTQLELRKERTLFSKHLKEQQSSAQHLILEAEQKVSQSKEEAKKRLLLARQTVRRLQLEREVDTLGRVEERKAASELELQLELQIFKLLRQVEDSRDTYDRCLQESGDLFAMQGRLADLEKQLEKQKRRKAKLRENLADHVLNQLANEFRHQAVEMMAQSATADHTEIRNGPINISKIGKRPGSESVQMPSRTLTPRSSSSNRNTDLVSPVSSRALRVAKKLNHAVRPDTPPNYVSVPHSPRPSRSRPPLSWSG